MNFIRTIISRMCDYYWFFIGLIIVCLLSIISLHSDFMVLTFTASKVAAGDFYIGHNMPPTIFLLDGLVFFIFKFFHIIPSSIVHIFHDDGIACASSSIVRTFHDIGMVCGSFSKWQMLLLKTRYIALFILSFVVIKEAAKEFTKDLAQTKIIANVWITSPLLLLLPFAQGNNDIYPVFFSLLFLLCVFKRQYVVATIMLGLVAALKNYALFLIPPMAIILAEKDRIKTVKYGMISVLVYIIPLLFYLKNFKTVITGAGEGVMFLQTVISGPIPYQLFTVAYCFILLFLIFSENEREIKENKSGVVVLYGFLITSLFFTFSFYIPQWFLWLLPFFVFLVYKSRKLYYIYILITCVYFVDLLVQWSNNLDLNLFRPIMPVFLKDVDLSFGLHGAGFVYSIFAALNLGFIYFLLKEYKGKIQYLPKQYCWLNLVPMVCYFLAMIGVFFFKLVVAKG